MYARRAQRHPYVREFIQERDGGICRWCGKRIYPGQKMNIHHMDYDHCCSYPGRVEIPTPTEKRQGRAFKGPDCQQCHASTPDAFNGCMSRLALVHSRCNAEINEVTPAHA